jgi:hypothetical protein
MERANSDIFNKAEGNPSQLNGVCEHVIFILRELFAGGGEPAVTLSEEPY